MIEIKIEIKKFNIPIFLLFQSLINNKLIYHISKLKLIIIVNLKIFKYPFLFLI